MSSMLVAEIAAAQWVVVAIASVVAPAKLRHALAVSTALFAGGLFFGFDRPKATALQASAIATTKHEGSCASIRNDMSRAEVTRRLGTADEIRNDEAVRGPGSSVLVYRDLRCAVHVLDDNVEFVE